MNLFVVIFFSLLDAICNPFLRVATGKILPSLLSLPSFAETLILLSDADPPAPKEIFPAPSVTNACPG